MQKLKTQNLSHLSESILRVLHQNRIITILDFLQEDVSKLCAISKLSLTDILTVRNEIFAKYSAPLITGATLLAKVLNTRSSISTGIPSLDAITDGGIPVGHITEVCGLADSGKTQLLFQLSINCVRETECTVLYINTKGDFSAVKIQKILEAQKCSNKEMTTILDKIRVAHVWSMDSLIELFKSIKNKSIVIENLCLIMVDSLPSLMFQYLGDESKVGLSLLNTLVNYSRFLCNELNIAIVYVNIQTRWIENDISDMEDDGESSTAIKETTYIEKRNRCLGKYWDQVPALILLLEKSEQSKEVELAQINISVTRSHANIDDLNKCTLDLSSIGII